MSLSRRRFICISAAAMALPNLSRADQLGELAVWKGNALGASTTLAIAGMTRENAQQIFARVEAELSRLENIFSLYQSDSVLSRLNRDGSVQALPLEFVQLLAQAGSINRATNGAFDPTIQPLWRAFADARGKPDNDAIERIRNNIGWQYLQFDAGKARFTRPDMAMTLNGIAQGFITDEIAKLLRSSGLKDVLVSMGEISAMGGRQPGAGWKIGINQKEDQVAEEFITLRDAAIATSAPLGTTLDDQANVGHIIDPRDATIPKLWQRISVIHKSAAIADGLSTAFAVMGKDEITTAIKHFIGTRVIAIDSNGRRFNLS